MLFCFLQDNLKLSCDLGVRQRSTKHFPHRQPEHFVALLKMQRTCLSGPEMAGLVLQYSQSVWTSIYVTNPITQKCWAVAKPFLSLTFSTTAEMQRQALGNIWNRDERQAMIKEISVGISLPFPHFAHNVLVGEGSCQIFTPFLKNLQTKSQMQKIKCVGFAWAGYN